MSSPISSARGSGENRTCAGRSLVLCSRGAKCGRACVRSASWQSTGTSKTQDAIDALDGLETGCMHGLAHTVVVRLGDGLTSHSVGSLHKTCVHLSALCDACHGMCKVLPMHAGGWSGQVPTTAHTLPTSTQREHRERRGA